MDQFLRDDAQKVVTALGGLNDKFSGKTILITGASGFLGSHFVHYFVTLNNNILFKRPCRIIALDNFIRKKPKWVNELKRHPHLVFRNQDIVSSSVNFKADFVIHAASIASPKFYRKYPVETMDTNVAGTRSILEYCKEQKVISMLFLSSSEIYGNPSSENIPTSEEFPGAVNNLGPRACYDESKRYAETLCYTFYKTHKIPVKIIRPFNIYGPGLHADDGRVISDFFRDAITKKRIELLSDGNSTRTFCYVSDAVTGFLQALLSKYEGEVFNIGMSEPEISMKTLAHEIKKVCSNDTAISFGVSSDSEYNTDSPKRRCPSIAKAKKMLGYKPITSLSEGLKITFSYYNHLLKSY